MQNYNVTISNIRIKIIRNLKLYALIKIQTKNQIRKQRTTPSSILTPSILFKQTKIKKGDMEQKKIISPV